ncbi:MAG: four helix bundle protein [Crocinitomicaceae bacterium]
MHNFRELKIWKSSMVLAKKILKLTKDFPNEERFGLKSQINRSCVSVASNLAEGSARTTDKEFSRFIDIALGSAYELETQIILASELNLFSGKVVNELVYEINKLQKMIRGFQKTLKI